MTTEKLASPPATNASVGWDDLFALDEAPLGAGIESAPRVLVAVDFDDASSGCLWQGALEARDRGGTLLLLHVRGVSEASRLLFGARPTSNEMAEVTQELVRLRLEEIAADVREAFPELPVAAVVIEGTPASVVVEVARQVGAERILVGAEGRIGLTQLTLGSVADEIVRTAPIPVVVVPRGDAQPV
jgi:nucleotide-binding universal stress UspA family protein